ncbi:UNVERIFIED_CONTAM: hypothetical protein FKN15_046843 [Acipenser sinensis]
MDLWSLIEQINEKAAAQKEQLERLEKQMGLAPLKRQEREPIELELLLQQWEQTSVAPQSPKPEGEEPPLPEPRGEEPPLPEPRGGEPPLPDPRGEEPPLPEPRGEEPPLPEPRGEEPPLPEPRGEEPPLPEPRGEEPPLPEPRGEEPPLPEPRGEEPPLPDPRGEEPPLPEPRWEEPPLLEPRGEEPPLLEPRGEEGKSIPPPLPRPPPLQSSSALLRPVPRPLLLDTPPFFLDLPVLDLEPRSLQHWPQLCPWFPAPLSPSTQTSLSCCQMSLLLPLFAASLPLGDRTSLHRFPGEDLCPLRHPPVPRPTLRSALSARWGPMSLVRCPFLAAQEGPTHPQARPWKRAAMDIAGLEAGVSVLGALRVHAWGLGAHTPSVLDTRRSTLDASTFVVSALDTWCPASAPATSRKASAFNLKGATEAGMASFPQVDAAFAALVKTPTLSGLTKDPACPNKQCRITETALIKDLLECPSVALRAELGTINQLLVKLAQLNARAQGRGIASLVVARRQLWLSQARVQEPDKAPLLDAPITPGHTFGPAVEEMLQRSAKAREASQQMAKMWPHKPFQPRRPQEHQWRRTPPQHQPRPGGTKTSPSSTAVRGQPPFVRPWRPRGGGRPRPCGSGQAPRERAQPKQP